MGEMTLKELVISHKNVNCITDVVVALNLMLEGHEVKAALVALWKKMVCLQLQMEVVPLVEELFSFKNKANDKTLKAIQKTP